MSRDKPWLVSATKRCRTALATRGVTPSSQADETNIDLACAGFFLLEASLARSHGRSDRASLSSALTSLGSSYISPIALGGVANYDSAHRDGGGTLFAIFGYNASCSCFRYASKPSPLIS